MSSGGTRSNLGRVQEGFEEKQSLSGVLKHDKNGSGEEQKGRLCIRIKA